MLKPTMDIATATAARKKTQRRDGLPLPMEAITYGMQYRQTAAKAATTVTTRPFRPLPSGRMQGELWHQCKNALNATSKTRCLLANLISLLSLFRIVYHPLLWDLGGYVSHLLPMRAAGCRPYRAYRRGDRPRSPAMTMVLVIKSSRNAPPTAKNIACIRDCGSSPQ